MPAIDDVPVANGGVSPTGEFFLAINLVYFFARGRHGDDPMATNVPCSVRTDGTELTAHQYIGGHPEWDRGTVAIGAKDDRQVLYDVAQQVIVGQIATPEIIPAPSGDVALSGSFFRGPYTSGELRIDPAPRWNRDQTALLVPAMTADGTRQLHLIEISD